jgi:hypothetical protein
MNPSQYEALANQMIAEASVDSDSIDSNMW